MDVVAPSLKGGDAKVCDIRGWGYLTGKGHGALGLPEAEAIAIQEANARLIAAAPELFEALRQIGLRYGSTVTLQDCIELAQSVIAKVEPLPAPLSAGRMANG
jgi:hypothetical protein